MPQEFVDPEASWAPDGRGPRKCHKDSWTPKPRGPWTQGFVDTDAPRSLVGPGRSWAPKMPQGFGDAEASRALDARIRGHRSPVGPGRSCTPKVPQAFVDAEAGSPESKAAALRDAERQSNENLG